MADTTKPVEVAQVAPVAEPVVETKPTETAAATTEAIPETAPAVEATPAAATETAAVAETPAAEAVAEEAKEEVKPVEEGHLEHKGQGANFPKNFIYSKTLFWFGSEPVDVKATSSFKADKVAEVAHHVTAWAAETGKGLLFYSEKGDKAAPHGAIQLAEASEPVTEGTNKFHFTAKGHKHAFKAHTTADRDNWVAQLKAKIAEAKELATTITESEKYKATLESLKPAPVKKEEKAVEAVAETPAATEETPATAEVPAVAAVETEAEATKEEVKEEEKKTEEAKKEEPKRRSASRKRASIFGSFLGKKEEKKTAETPEVSAEAETPATDAAPAVDAETSVVEAPAVEATPEVAPVATETAVSEAKPEEKSEEKKEEVAEAVRPSVPAKRSSIFGNLSFGKKKPAPAAETPVKETPATETVAETAPVIPAVATTEPLSTEVSSPATVPTETVEATPAAAATNGETKKEVKSDKRKSSLPFAFGKKKEGTTSDEEGEKPKSPSAFSKLRATIKGKGKTEKVEKSEETPAVPALPAAEDTPVAATEEAKPAETTEVAAAAPAAEAEEDKPAKPLEATPVVTATA